MVLGQLGGKGGKGDSSVLPSAAITAALEAWQNRNTGDIAASAELNSTRAGLATGRTSRGISFSD